MITLSGRLPKRDHNGLETIRAALIECATEPQIVLGIVDCARLVTDTDRHHVVPTARFQAVEGILLDTPAGRAAYELWRDAWRLRTGLVELPFNQ